MRFALVPLVVLAASFTVATDPPAVDPCVAWNLLGYRLGMTRAEALALHGGQFHRKSISRFPKGAPSQTSKYDDLHADVVRSHPYPPETQEFDPHLIVRFERGGDIAIAVHRLSDVDPGALKLDLVRKFGSPVADTLQLGADKSPYGGTEVIRTRWESVECDSDLILDVERQTFFGASDSFAHVVLVRHGGHYESR